MDVTKSSIWKEVNRRYMELKQEQHEKHIHVRLLMKLFILYYGNM